MDRSCAERTQIKDRSWFIRVWTRIYIEIRELYECWRAYRWTRNREYTWQAEKRKDGLLRSNRSILFILTWKGLGSFFFFYLYLSLHPDMWETGRRIVDCRKRRRRTVHKTWRSMDWLRGSVDCENQNSIH